MGTFGLSILGLGLRLPDHLERSPFKRKGTNFVVEPTNPPTHPIIHHLESIRVKSKSCLRNL